MSKPSLFLFCGEDSYSATQKCLLWRAEFEKKYGDLNIIILEGEKLTAGAFSEAVEVIPFLSEKKLIIINNFLRDGSDIEQKKIAEKLENIPDFSVVVFLEIEKPDARLTLYKRITKLGKKEEFPLLNGPKLVSFIQTMVQKNGGQIDPKEASLLAEMVGPNLWQMEQEIKKLCLYCSGKITPEAIEQLVSPNIATSVFKLTDYIGQKRTKESLKTFHQLLESGEDLMKILFMIIRQFRLIIQIHDLLDKNFEKTEIGKKMKEHPFVVSTVIHQSKNFDSSTLKKVYQDLLNIDKSIKSGGIRISTGDTKELRLAVEKFIVELCQK